MPTPPSFVILDGRAGRKAPSSFAAVADAMLEADVVLIGEFHDDPVAHEVELLLLKTAVERAGPRQVSLSLEMFESDAQLVMDEYLTGTARERDLVKDGRAWPNYHKDYRPLVELAREKGLRVVCANAPRRYVSLVGREGRGALERLGPAARALLPPLPFRPPSEAYARKVDALMRLASGPRQAASEPSSAPANECPYIGLSINSRFLDAQTLWDAAMAHAISRELRRQDGSPGAAGGPRPLVVHVTGKAHVEGGLGIPEHLTAYSPGARILTVVIDPVEGGQLVAEGETMAADFIVLSDGRLPRSFESIHPV